MILQKIDALEEERICLQTKLEQHHNAVTENRQMHAKLEELEMQHSFLKVKHKELVNSKRRLSVQLSNKNKLTLNLEKSMLIKENLNNEIAKTNREIKKHEYQLRDRIQELDQVIVEQGLHK